ncbi:MAG: hypothetical protein PHW54_02270 [Candidatus Omnitrophica bacterium]|nr:hypothetical protein [Candidatus Omnitrophota bacterium]
MPISTFLFMNYIVAVSSFIIAYRLFRIPDFVDSLICWFILYLAQVLAVELLLGFFGILYLKNLILFNLAVLLIVWLIARKYPSSFDLGPVKEGASLVLHNKLFLFVACLILSFTSVKIYASLINPPLGWDSLNYHFTFAVEWLKHGNLNNPIVASDDPFPSYYPINGSLFFLWLILPFKNAFLADLGQLPFFLVSFLAILSVSRKLGLGKEYSFFAACLFIMIPNFFKQLGIGYVDIMLGGIFLAALNFILRLKEEFNFKGVIIAALSFGIFIGIKTTALPYSIFLLFPFLYLIFSRKNSGIKAKIAYVILFLLPVFIFGGFSYIRNFILTGNPFYPLDMAISGKTIFKGVIDKATFIARNEIGGYSIAKLLFHEGMGVQTLLIILPGVILALPASIWKNKNRDLFFSYIMILPFLLYLCYRFVLPIPNSRYLYPMLGIGMAAGFYVSNSLKVPLKIVKAIFFVSVVASSFECARKMELGISWVLTFILFIAALLILKHKKLRVILSSKAVIVAVIFISFLVLQGLLLDYNKNEYIRYIKNSRYWPDATRAWDWLNNNTDGNSIAYVGRPVPYPLYGTNLKNNVYYVSVNSLDPIRLHDLKYSRYRWDSAENMHINFEAGNNYRGNADYTVWLNNLYKRNTDFLFIYSLHHTKDTKFPIEEIWAKAHPDKFNPVFSNNTIRIYKLIK